MVSGVRTLNATVLSSIGLVVGLFSILYRLIKCLSFCIQVEGTFLRLAQGVSGVQQEHVVIEVNSLK
jgi:hypothetical protein